MSKNIEEPISTLSMSNLIGKCNIRPVCSHQIKEHCYEENNYHGHPDKNMIKIVIVDKKEYITNAHKQTACIIKNYYELQRNNSQRNELSEHYVANTNANSMDPTTWIKIIQKHGRSGISHIPHSCDTCGIIAASWNCVSIRTPMGTSNIATSNKRILVELSTDLPFTFPLTETLPILDEEKYNRNTCKQPTCILRNCNELNLQKNNLLYNELLEHCASTTDTANSIDHGYTATDIIAPAATTNYNEMVWEHGESGTSHNSHKYDTCEKFDAFISKQLPVDTGNITGTNNQGMLSELSTDLPYSLSLNLYSEKPSKIETKQFFLEILLFINLLLCMLIKHLMFIAQRASKGYFSPQSKTITMIIAYCDHLVNKCFITILLVTNYFYNNNCDEGSNLTIGSDDNDVHYIVKDLPWKIVRISCLRVLSSSKLTRLSLWCLWSMNIFELLNEISRSGNNSLDEQYSTCYGITLQGDCMKLYSNQYSAITILYAVFTIMLSYYFSGLFNITLPCSGLTNIGNKLTHERDIFEELVDVMFRDSCFNLQLIQWLFLRLSLSDCKHSTQFITSLLQNLHNDSILAFAVVHDCSDEDILMTHCYNSWPSIREMTIGLCNSSRVIGEHEVQELTQYIVSLIAIVTIVGFVVLYCLPTWKNIFSIVPLVTCFTAKSLVAGIVNITANYYHKLSSMKYFQLFESMQNLCDSVCCLVFRITLKSVYSTLTNYSCEHLLHYTDMVPQSTANNDSLAVSPPPVAVTDNEDVHETVHHVLETCRHDNNNGTELVIGATGCIWGKSEHYVNFIGFTSSHDASNRFSFACDDDVPLCIPSSDSNSHEVVIASVCTEPVFELQYQAGCRNADHTFVQNEKSLVRDNLFLFPSALGNANIIFENHRRQYIEDNSYIQDGDTDDSSFNQQHVNTEIEATKATRFEEETSHSNYDTENCKSYIQDQAENIKELTKKKNEDDDGDDDDSDDTDSISAEEYQPYDPTNDESMQCCSVDDGKLIIGTYTTGKAYGASHSVLSFNGLVFHIHACTDTARPVGGDHVSKPTASNNQPPRFECNASRLTAHQQTPPPTICAARTECGQRQQITSTDNDALVEKDGRLENDASLIPKEQSITAKGATPYPNQLERNGPHYCNSKFREDAPSSYERVKHNSKTTFLQHEVKERNQQQSIARNDRSILPQTTKQSTVSNTTGSLPKSLPRRSCMVVGNTQYPLTPYLLAHPRMDHFFVKERREIKPGHFLAKLVLQHHFHNMQDSNTEDNEAATAAQQSQAAAIVADSVAVEKDGAVTKRQHFAMNVNRPGYIVFSSDLTRFTGDKKYPVPGRKATAVKIGRGGNGFVFTIFHNGKEYAVKKTVYRPNEIRVHSQLAHINLVNLEAVLIGEEHEHHKGKFYAFYFMNKLDMDFRSVISTKEHGCLKHLKLQLSEQRNVWEVVMVNVKYVLRSVLKALDYMQNQGLVHRDVKASNILLKMNCQCTKPLMCACPQKYLVKLGDFDSSTTVPGYGLKIEPHQLIRYASVLPLGTTGYRAPEVSMHLVISGPYEVLYTTAVDIWSFGCLLLNILIGKSGPLKQRGEASLLLSVQDQPYSEDLYNKIIKMKELQKYYSDIPEIIDLVRKCLQVKVHCRPTAKQLLQLDILQC